jgi:HPt (histidine-containing phosphotransfer) domain-containing protein
MNLVNVTETSAPNHGEIPGNGLHDDGGPIISSLIHHPRMKVIIGEYVRQFPEIVDRLLDLLERADLANLRRLAHQLRGTGGGYGFDALSELAGKVEDSIVASNLPISIAALTHSLIDVIRRTDGYGQGNTTVPIEKNAA